MLTPFLERARRQRAWSCRATTSRGCPPTCRALLHRLRASGAEVAKLAVMVERASDLRTLLEQARPDAGIDPDRHGAGRAGDAGAGGTVRIALDVCRQRRRARAGFGVTAAAGVPLPPHPSRRRGLRAPRPAGRRLAVAGDAQRRVRRARTERGVCPDRVARRRRAPRARRRARHARRERDDPVQAAT